MKVAEAVALVDLLSQVDPFAKRRGPDELARAAAAFAAVLEDVPIEWASRWARDELRRGNHPAVTDFATAWRQEAIRRVQAVPIPAAPPEIEADATKWQAWERARRSALVQGATGAQAAGYADRQLGVANRQRIEGRAPSPQRVADAKSQLRAQIAAWSAKQREANEDLGAGR